jgi:hypothetical protein
VHPGVSNVFAVLRLLPMSDRDKDMAILALCHQASVLERQWSGQRAPVGEHDRRGEVGQLQQHDRSTATPRQATDVRSEEPAGHRSWMRLGFGTHRVRGVA